MLIPQKMVLIMVISVRNCLGTWNFFYLTIIFQLSVELQEITVICAFKGRDVQ